MLTACTLGFDVTKKIIVNTGYFTKEKVFEFVDTFLMAQVLPSVKEDFLKYKQNQISNMACPYQNILSCHPFNAVS